ncbi:MAG: AAA family ATPase [Solirubrobacteraceae bacterium]
MSQVNPFVFDRPLAPRELIDRETELSTLMSLAVGGQSARLAAPRRYGKTTLLGALVDRIEREQRFVATLLDFSRVSNLSDVVARFEQGYADGLERGKLRAVWRAVRRRAFADAHLRAPGGLAGMSVGIGPGHDGDLLSRLHHLLEVPRAVHERTGRQCLVIFDEFQDLLKVVDGVDGVLRSHIQHHYGVASYVFAGSEPSLMTELFGDRKRPLFEQARGVPLGPLPLVALATWLEARLADREPLGEFVDELVAFSGGHPQRTVMIAHMLWEQDPDDLDSLSKALDAAIREAAEGLEQTWAGLTANERKVLGVVAAGQRRITTKAALQLSGLGKSSQVYAASRLVNNCILGLSPGGLYGVVDPLLARWLVAVPR